MIPLGDQDFCFRAWADLCGSAKSKGTGGTATGRKDETSHEKTKREFPEAPDTIGMQDERGGRGA